MGIGLAVADLVTTVDDVLGAAAFFTAAGFSETAFFIADFFVASFVVAILTSSLVWSIPNFGDWSLPV